MRGHRQGQSIKCPSGYDMIKIGRSHRISDRLAIRKQPVISNPGMSLEREGTIKKAPMQAGLASVLSNALSFEYVRYYTYTHLNTFWITCSEAQDPHIKERLQRGDPVKPDGK